jgi:putative hydrolase of the HAD superfamily
VTWLLCDYGEVLSLPQPPEALAALTALTGMDGDAFHRAYWAPRPAYDRGDIDAGRFWTEVLGADPGGRLPALVDADVAGWLHPNEASLEAVARAAARGLRLAILSNAPHEVARAIDARPWLEPFGPRVFSCDLRAVKPEPAAYHATLERLGAAPGDVVFLDDRPPNVAAARAAGMRAEVFTDPAQIDLVEP